MTTTNNQRGYCIQNQRLVSSWLVGWSVTKQMIGCLDWQMADFSGGQLTNNVLTVGTNTGWLMVGELVYEASAWRMTKSRLTTGWLMLGCR